MARYRVNEAHFLDNKYIEAGSIVDWDGPPSRQMTPVEQVAEERKAKYDADRPHLRASRDLPPKAVIVRDVMQRQPGQPRAAGPPGQAPAPSADPHDPQRTAEIVEQRIEAAEQEPRLIEESLKQPAPAGVSEGKAEVVARDKSTTERAAAEVKPARASRAKPSKPSK